MEVENKSSNVDSKKLRWQVKLLPFVILVLTVLIIAFLVLGSFYAFSINRKNDIMIDNHFSQFQSINHEWKNLSEESLALMVLEEKSMNYRFVQSINTNKYNVWMRFTMYLIGTIMCFIGSIFILSKISEDESNFAGEGGGLKLNLSSSSPGLLLAFFGSVLITVGIYKTNSFDFNDAPRYVNSIIVKNKSDVIPIIESSKKEKLLKEFNPNEPLE